MAKRSSRVGQQKKSNRSRGNVEDKDAMIKSLNERVADLEGQVDDLKDQLQEAQYCRESVGYNDKDSQITAMEAQLESMTTYAADVETENTKLRAANQELTAASEELDECRKTLKEYEETQKIIDEGEIMSVLEEGILLPKCKDAICMREKNGRQQRVYSLNDFDSHIKRLDHGKKYYRKLPNAIKAVGSPGALSVCLQVEKQDRHKKAHRVEDPEGATRRVKAKLSHNEDMPKETSEFLLQQMRTSDVVDAVHEHRKKHAKKRMILLENKTEKVAKLKLETEQFLHKPSPRNERFTVGSPVPAWQSSLFSPIQQENVQQYDPDYQVSQLKEPHFQSPPRLHH